MAADRGIYLLRCLDRKGNGIWLGIDLAGGDQVREFPGPLDPPPDGQDAMVIAPVDEPCRNIGRAGLFLPEGVLWSFLDPMRAQLPRIPDWNDRIAVEQELRRLARRFRDRLIWWKGLPPSLKESCRGLLRGFRPDLTVFLDQLDRVPVAPPVERETAAPAPIDAPDQSGSAVPSDPETIYQWFTAADGLGAAYGPEFRSRPEQAEMAREVASALQDHEPLLMEAGTGVGKTLAYLVPLVAALEETGGRVVVSTHTRALQIQILEKDLPRLRAILGQRKFALLMGRRNYLCLRQRQAFATRPLENLADALQAVAFRLWLDQTTHGMREELAGHPLLEPELGKLFDAPDPCLPGQCYEGNRCFVQKARQTARSAELLVVNHSLLLHDLRAENTLLGEYDFLVVDEAHRLPAVVLETHGITVGLWRLEEVEDLLGRVRGRGGNFQRLDLAAQRLQVLGKEGQRAAAACNDFGGVCSLAFKRFREWWRALAELVDREMSGSSPRMGRVRVRDKDEAFGSIRPATGLLLEALAGTREAFATLGRRTGVLDELSAALEDDLALIGQAGQLLGQLYHEVKFLATDPDEDWVTWIEPGRTKGIRRLGATLLEAGTILREYWSAGDRAPVMTSATLAVGEDFTHMMNELGLTRRRPATRTFTCPSPFDYHSQVRILAPARFPAPGSTGFSRAVGEILAAVGQRVPRKTMGLFTSYRMIKEVEEVLAGAGLQVSGAPGRRESVPVFSQRPDSSPGHLLERFRSSSTGILLGTNTFWEGVDFPGQDLEILLVSKLPFLVPNDPWVEARCERVAAAGENPFTSFMVRDAVLRLRQGFGRLIRRVSDKGVVIILDNRLHTKNYGVTFLGALPVVPETFTDTGDLLGRLSSFFHKA